VPRRILVVDDEAAIRRVVVSLLGGDYECEDACDGAQALEVIARSNFDLVLTDVRMPNLTGLDLLARLRRERPDLVVILITGAPDVRTTAQALNEGAFDYIVKPFALDDLEACVHRAIHYKSMMDENRLYYERLERLAGRTSTLLRENERLEGSLLDVTISYRVTLSVLTAALEMRDMEANGHSERVTAFAVRLGLVLGLAPGELEALEHGGLLHDIGTIFVPESVLRKRGKLTPEEWALMRQHPEHGGRLLRRIGLLANAAPVVEQHHERWDGSGYPLGLRGTEIDLKARIFAVADCIEAMTSERAYSVARPFSEVADELLRCKGTHFDPDVVDAFFEVRIEDWEATRRRPQGHIAAAIPPVTGPLVLPPGIVA
jgi:response regulator RpfG family c-di-GMP phosphodiesterase